MVVGWVSDPGRKRLYPAEGTPGFLVGGRSILVLLIGVQLLRYPDGVWLLVICNAAQQLLE